jgi:hypothetical protein
MQDDGLPPAQPTTRRAQAKAERRQAMIDATITSIALFGLSGTTVARVTVAWVEALGQGADSPPRDALQTALGLEAFYDGLWLNHLLYPEDFKRIGCCQRAIEHLAALFPAHFSGPQTVAARASGGLPLERT